MTSTDESVHGLVLQPSLLPVKKEKYDFVINIPHYEEGDEGFLWRRACLDFKVPVITNSKKAKTLLNALCRTNGPYEVSAGTDIL